MSKIHLDILDEPRKQIFSTLSYFKNEGYLSGGTALALQLNHRRSVDFDIFINKPIYNSLRLKVKKQFSITGYHVNNQDQLTFATKDAIEITFLWYYFAPVKPLVKTESISLSSIADIAADKAITLGRRAMWRDYVDIFYLINKKILTLAQIAELAKQKFGNEFNEILFLQQLSYFGDVKTMPIDFIDESFSDKEIVNLLTAEVEKRTKKIII